VGNALVDQAVDNVSLDHSQGQRPEKGPLSRGDGSQMLGDDRSRRACLTKRFGLIASRRSDCEVVSSCKVSYKWTQGRAGR
jgi:hypothetical protein